VSTKPGELQLQLTICNEDYAGIHKALII